mmetsp:Transcript_13237/g.34499  ORF Transcript_13237/g.34499 Transcript_13237/m.34499 type:complete len:202 (+) Transcript_13237:123-728(+)
MPWAVRVWMMVSAVYPLAPRLAGPPIPRGSSQQATVAARRPGPLCRFQRRLWRRPLLSLLWEPRPLLASPRHSPLQAPPPTMPAHSRPKPRWTHGRQQSLRVRASWWNARATAAASQPSNAASASQDGRGSRATARRAAPLHRAKNAPRAPAAAGATRSAPARSWRMRAAQHHPRALASCAATHRSSKSQAGSSQVALRLA